ncbi:succinate dehydrogenase, hydrophobic membrane anchor protein [Sphingomonas sp. RB1R13]|uniref:succinate dehydrogenase, hydrophobic membrane anchor protein n=1 Tax=Sphingomonas sp. RB1R13 TaxID=3096159 RepID=UPI002FCB0960
MSMGDSSTPLGKVRGLGAARSGGGHWLDERISSVALVLLSVWLIASLVMLPDLHQPTVFEWLHSATGAVPMALFVILSFVHGLEGMKVIVDDYVHDEGNRVACNIVLLFAAVGGAAFALFALAKIAFGAAA